MMLGIEDISCWSTSISPGPKPARARSMYASSMSWFAPPNRRMQFLPLLSTWIIAWPVATLAISMRLVSTPPPFSVFTRNSPSAPIFPAWTTLSPALAIARDWLRPLPPANTESVWAAFVSPGFTNSSTRYT